MKSENNEYLKFRKPIIMLCIVFLGFTTVVKAQESRESLVFGLKAGLNYSNVWDENGQDFRADGKAGFVGGAFLGIPIGTYLGIQPEVLFSQKGFKGSGTLIGSSYDFSRTTSYLDIPLLVQLKPSEFLTIVLGPQFSYLLNQKNVFTVGPNSVEQEQEFANDNIRKNILGFATGLDVNISNLVLSGRVNWDLQTNHGDGTSSTPRYKNQWLQFTVGYRFF